MSEGVKVKVVRPRITQESFLKGKIGVIERVVTIDELERKGLEYPRLIVSFFGGEYTTAMYYDEVLGIN